VSCIPNPPSDALQLLTRDPEAVEGVPQPERHLERGDRAGGQVLGVEDDDVVAVELAAADDRDQVSLALGGVTGPSSTTYAQTRAARKLTV